MAENKIDMETFSNFLKSKGFIYKGSDIYGGLSGVYDYGNLGCELKKNWINEWRKFFLRLNDNFVEIDTSVIMHENVFKASGHLENFYDPIAECKNCEYAGRADHIIEENLNIKAEGLSSDDLYKLIIENGIKCPECGSDFEKVENLNMMFPVDMGPKKGIRAYLRPETAQTPYVNFRQQFEIQRKRLPLGIGMIGKVFRNEIAPRNLVLRTREIEQAELQIFFNPSKIVEHEDFDSIKDYKLKVLLKDKREEEPQDVTCEEMVKYGLPKFYVYNMAKMQQFFLDVMNLEVENFRLYELDDEEKAFYNKYHFDVEYKLNNPNSWTEIGGVHYRTDHDLKGHQDVSKVKMEVVDEETKEKFIPHVLELSIGLGRSLYSILDTNYDDDKDRGNIVLKLPSKFSPYKVAIFPLVNKGGLPEVSREIFNELLEEDINVFYDRSGSVGKRYARQDEIGTPYCITVDFETVEDGENKGTVTIRDRDSTKQKRVKIDEIINIIKKLIKEKINFDEI